MKVIVFLISLMVYCSVFAKSINEEVQVYGRVLDKKTKTPIENVLVNVSGQNSLAYTDADGFFLITGKKTDDLRLVFKMIGYQYKSIKIKRNEIITIRLDQEHVELKEVTIVGKNSAKPIVKKIIASHDKNYHLNSYRARYFCRNYIKEGGLYVHFYDSYGDYFFYNEHLSDMKYEMYRISDNHSESTDLTSGVLKMIPSTNIRPSRFTHALLLPYIYQPKLYQYRLIDSTYNNNTEYKIAFQLMKKRNYESGASRKDYYDYSGVFYVNKEDYAIVRQEIHKLYTPEDNNRGLCFADSSKTTYYYEWQLRKGKYALSNTRKQQRYIKKREDGHWSETRENMELNLLEIDTTLSSKDEIESHFNCIVNTKSSHRLLYFYPNGENLCVWGPPIRYDRIKFLDTPDFYDWDKMKSDIERDSKIPLEQQFERNNHINMTDSTLIIKYKDALAPESFNMYMRSIENYKRILKSVNE